MKPSIPSVKGVHTVLPEQTSLFQHIAEQCAAVLNASCYREIGLPLIERTELFSTSIGDETDIVQKEMFTFEDRSGDLLTLRPEGTAGCARAVIEHDLYQTDSRLWYRGAFFRRERPQKGRQRQFHQIGAEAYGMSDPAVDAEIITMTAQIWQRLNIGSLRLELNNLGSLATQQAYAKDLSAWLASHEDRLDDNAKRRLHSNPLRILDSKNPEVIALLADAPLIDNYWEDDSAAYFERLKHLLTQSGVEFAYNPLLVRGLDYYTGPVFEWIDPQGAAQSTVCAGGRYDNLVERLGGKPIPAAGFALGVERLALVPGIAVPPTPQADVYFVAANQDAVERMHVLAFALRDALPGLDVLADCNGGSFKAQLRRADKSGAKIAVILGEDEIKSSTASIKYLRDDTEQTSVAQSDLVNFISKNISQ